MNNILRSRKPQRLKHLNSESSNNRKREPLKVIRLNKLIKIQMKHFKRNTQMFSKHNVFFNSNNIMHIIWIVISEMF